MIKIIKNIPIYRKHNINIGYVNIYWDTINKNIKKMTHNFKREYFLKDTELLKDYIIIKTNDKNNYYIYIPQTLKIFCYL